MSEREAIQHFYDLQTCSDRRLKKIKGIIENSKKLLGKNLSKLKITDITTYAKRINQSDYTEWTKNDYKKIFKSFLKTTYKEEFFSWFNNRNVSDGFRCASKKRAFNKEKVNKQTLITPKELEKLLRAADTLKWKALLTLMYESAFRPCEIVNLKWKDLTFIDSKGICSVKTISPKTKEKRSIPVKDCVVHVKRWMEEYDFPDRNDEDYVFPSPYNRKKHIAEAGIPLALTRLCKKAGIKRNIYPYLFRHSRIYFIQKKLGARLASTYAGHSLETSEIYNHMDDDDVEEAMLEKVYVTEELTEEQKTELEKKVEQQQKALEEAKMYNQEWKKNNEKMAKEFETLQKKVLELTKMVQK
jgi:integrase